MIVFIFVYVAVDADVPHDFGAVRDMARYTVAVAGSLVETLIGVIVTCNAFGVLLLNVGIMTFRTCGVCVGFTWESNLHDLFVLMAVHAVLPKGEQVIFLYCKIMANEAVYVHLGFSHHHCFIVAFAARLLWRLEDVKLDSMAVDALGWLGFPKEVNFVPRGIDHLKPVRVFAGVAVLTYLVVDLSRDGDLLGVLCYNLDHVAKALPNARLVAFVTVDIMHGAALPGLISRVHQVAPSAESSVILDIIVGKNRWY